MKHQTVLIFTLLGFATVIAQDRCQIGTCTVLQECPKLYDLLLETPKSQENVDFLRSRFCGNENRQPKVCCTYKEKGFRRLDINGQSVNNFEDAEDPYAEARRLLPSECGKDSSNRIIGGEITEIDEFPWMALIEYREGNEKTERCAGALISKRYVLTAAHCFKFLPKHPTIEAYAVRLGEYNTSTRRDCVAYGEDEEICADEAVSVAIEKRIIHESYNANRKEENDIALLRLARDVRFTDYIKPICMPAGSNVKDNLVVAGWGKTETGAKSAVKLKLTLPVVPPSRCAEKGDYVPLVDSQICAGGRKAKDSCVGDSGGPLMQQSQRPGDDVYRWEAVGVVSYGKSTKCGLEGWPAVYTKVSNFLPWILSKIRP